MKAGDEAGANPKGTLAPGLYLVATPIGNLEDITLRAVRVLKEADLIACEDTRQTQKLLNHYGITTRTSSYHEHNEMTRSAELVLDLEGGAQSRPGNRRRNARHLRSRLSPDFSRHSTPYSSGSDSRAHRHFWRRWWPAVCPPTRFASVDFLPPKSGQRRQMLESISASPRTQIFYEAPHRVKEAVEDVIATLGGERHIVIAREVTKIHEEFLRGRASEILEILNARGDIKGEITLLIGKAEDTERKAAAGVSIRQRLQQIMTDEKLDEKAALKKIAKEMGVSKSEAYRELQRSR